MDNKFLIHSLNDYKAVFKELDDKDPRVVLLSGDLGAGKTSLTGAYLSYLHSEEKVSEQSFMSPTFNIINQYELDDKTYTHVDLYRLKFDDIEDLDLGELLNSSSMVFIEWYEINKEITQALSEKTAFIDLRKTKGEVRELSLTFTY